MNTQRIELDISKPDALTTAVTIGQGDKAGTTIIATIYDNGILASLSGMSAQFECRLPDGRSYVRDANCAVSGSEITYVMDEEHVAAVAGATDEAYFTILDGTQEVYSTNRFRLKVLRSAHDGAVPAESWDTAVDELIQRGNAALEEYAEAEEDREEAETSRATAEAARATAETARQTAETARSSAESSRANAEAQRSTNEAERAEEEAERASAETAREAAERLRESAETARASADATRQQHQDTNDAHQSQNDSAQLDNDTNQARNNADQALNNQAAQGLVAVILTSGQYNPTTLEPTVTGEVGKMYLVPKASSTGDHYLEWLWLGSEWECMGSTQTTIEGITTSNIDAVADDEAPQGNSVLTLTGLSYLWTKIKDFVATAILGKQDRLTAGSNVQISNNTISATDTTYTAGTNVSISASNQISATDTKYYAGTGLSKSSSNYLSVTDGYPYCMSGTNVKVNGSNVGTADNLAYVASTNTFRAPTYAEATRNTAKTTGGWIHFERCGPLAIVNISLNCSTITRLDVLGTGLPIPAHDANTIIGSNNHRALPVYIDTSGNLIAGQTVDAAWYAGSIVYTVAS